MTETDVGAPSALIGTGKRALPQAPLLPQPACQPSLPSGYATHTPRGIFCWLTMLRKRWEWFLCLPACSSWADLMETVPLETAYLSLERILNSKTIDLWFCLYCSGRHTAILLLCLTQDYQGLLWTAVGIENNPSAVLDTFPLLAWGHGPTTSL